MLSQMLELKHMIDEVALGGFHLIEDIRLLYIEGECRDFRLEEPKDVCQQKPANKWQKSLKLREQPNGGVKYINIDLCLEADKFQKEII